MAGAPASCQESAVNQDEKDAKAERLAHALRENLRRRKAQSRELDKPKPANRD